MKTQILSTIEKDIKRAGRIIVAGGLVAFPTETVYGLGANALSERAVGSVYAAKGRPSDNPMIVHVSEIDEVAPLVAELPENVRNAMEQLWPGPITFVLRKSDRIPDVVTGGLDTVAIRMPASEVARKLISAAGKPIAAPSANLSGKPSPTTYEDVLEDMDGKIDAIIAGDPCVVGIESTVLDMTEDIPTILRPGYVTREMLERALETEVCYADNVSEADAPRSPGMKYKHYSPKAKVRIIAGSDEDAQAYMISLGLAARKKGLRTALIDYGNNAEKATRKFFADLRELDRQGYDIIMVRPLKAEGLGVSIMNRMLKSAGYDVVETTASERLK